MTEILIKKISNIKLYFSLFTYTSIENKQFMPLINTYYTVIRSLIFFLKKHNLMQTKDLVERACLQKMPSLEPLGPDSNTPLTLSP